MKRPRHGPPLFYFDFIAFPILAAVLLAMFCRSVQFAALVAFGIVMFSLAEYWVHRIALHRFFYHGHHEHHHRQPGGYVVFPVYFIPMIFAGFYFVMPLPVFTGVVLGFCWFIYWHHFLHHFDLNSWPRFVQRYALWHLKHHNDDRVNFGITTSIWDWMFRTYRA